MITFTTASSSSIGRGNNDGDNNNVAKEQPGSFPLSQDLGHLTEPFLRVQTHPSSLPNTPTYLFSPPLSSPPPTDPAMMTAKALKRAPDPPLHFRAGAKRPLTYERRSSPTPGGAINVGSVGGSGAMSAVGSGQLTAARAVSLQAPAASFTTMALPQDDFSTVSLANPPPPPCSSSSSALSSLPSPSSSSTNVSSDLSGLPSAPIEGLDILAAALSSSGLPTVSSFATRRSPTASPTPNGTIDPVAVATVASSSLKTTAPVTSVSTKVVTTASAAVSMATAASSITSSPISSPPSGVSSVTVTTPKIVYLKSNDMPKAHSRQSHSGHSESQIKSDFLGSTSNTARWETCPTPGCDGSGNAVGTYSSHRSLSGCPRATTVMKRAKLSSEAMQEIHKKACAGVDLLSNDRELQILEKEIEMLTKENEQLEKGFTEFQGKLKADETELTKTLKENRERAEKNSYLKRYYDHVKAQLAERLVGLPALRDIPELDLGLIDRDFDSFIDKLKSVVVERFRANDKALYNILKATVHDIRICYTK